MRATMTLALAVLLGACSWTGKPAAVSSIELLPATLPSVQINCTSGGVFIFEGFPKLDESEEYGCFPAGSLLGS